MTPWRERTAVVLLFVVALGFIALRLFGHNYFSNNWSFLHWQHQPWWYSVLWSVLFLTAIVFAFLKSKQLADFFNSRLRKIGGLLLLVILLVLFQSDSILFAGGNRKISQIAQTDYVIHRWFEYGSSLLVSAFYELFKLFGMVANTAAGFAWSALLWISTLMSLWGSVVLTGELTKRFEIRFWLFLIIFFGPQAIAYLGLLGPNVTFIPVVIWLTIFAFRAMKNRSLTSMIMTWVVFIVGILFNHICALLFPAVVYTTLRSTLQLKRWSIVTLVSTFVSFVTIFVAFYFWGWKDLEFSRFILFPDGKSPLSDYGIFSPRHLNDIFQIILLVFPQILVVFFLFLTERRQAGNFFLNGLSWLLLVIGAGALFMIDPINNIVLDLPRLAVLLVGAGIVAASVVRLSLDRTESSPRLPAILAVIALFLPLSVAPVYSKISIADSYVEDYIDKNEPYYINGAITLRDAYFYNKQIEKANKWDQLLRASSGDFVGFIGAQYLAQGGQFDGAAEEFYRLKTKYPFWTEPRFQLAQVQMSLNQTERANAEIDTLLMIEPYNKTFHVQLIKYYLRTNSFIAALNASKDALTFFPNDTEIEVEQMNALFQSGSIPQADSLARDLIRIDSTLAYPYLFRALILEQENNSQLAARNYEMFLSLAPDSPEAPEIRKRLNSIIVKQQDDVAESEN